MDLDEGGAFRDDSSSFDSQLWFFLTARVSSSEDAATLAEPIWVYLASRWLEWEVGNGGFPQAAYNVPDWFELAESAYQKLGLEDAAGLIARARKLIAGGETRGFVSRHIGELFEQFRDSELAELDEQLEAVNWWAGEVRLAYVRRHRDAFREFEKRRPGRSS